jgi:hypothetical protein
VFDYLYGLDQEVLQPGNLPSPGPDSTAGCQGRRARRWNATKGRKRPGLFVLGRDEVKTHPLELTLWECANNNIILGYDVPERPIAQIRKSNQIPIPTKKDSVYKPVTRTLKVFSKLSIPKKLQEVRGAFHSFFTNC